MNRGKHSRSKMPQTGRAHSQHWALACALAVARNIIHWNLLKHQSFSRDRTVSGWAKRHEKQVVVGSPFWDFTGLPVPCWNRPPGGARQLTAPSKGHFRKREHQVNTDWSLFVLRTFSVFTVQLSKPPSPPQQTLSQRKQILPRKIQPVSIWSFR